MEITIFGIIWLIMLLITLFLPIKNTVGLLMISTIFQSSAVINLQAKGINPIIVTEAFLLFRYIINKKIVKKYTVDKNTNANKKLIQCFVIFFIVSISLSFVASLLFNDINVDNLYPLNPIDFGFNTGLILKTIMLFMHIVAMYIVYKVRYSYSNKFILNVATITIIIVLIFGYWEFIWKISNKAFYFPADIIYNNVGYAQGYDQGYLEGQDNINRVRMNSTFLEPSYCGAFLAASFIAMFRLYINTKEKRIKKILFFLVIALILNLSGTGMAALIIGFLLLIIPRLKLKKNNIFWLCVYIILIIIILMVTGYLERLYSLIFEKLDNISGIQRGYFNDKAFEIFIRTFAIGGGLSCYRASSFFFSLLATTGIAGTAIFVYGILSYFKVIKNKKNIFLKFGYVYLATVIIGMCVAIPDLNFFPLWFGIFYLISIKDEGEDKLNEKNRYDNIKLQ